jgi:predicted MFS family arabinose efflux permease
VKVAGRVAESLRAFREVFRNPDLRRLELAWAGSMTGTWAYGIGLAVFAYEAGGASAVGLVGFGRWAAAALAAPLTGALGDRFARGRVMVVADLLRAVALVAAALVVFAGAPQWIVYVLSGLVAIVATAFRPAQAALVPSLARTPEELTAANVVAATIESVGIFAGPALGGLLLAVSSTGVVFLVTAGTFVWSAALVLRIREERPADEAPRAREGPFAHMSAGFRVIAHDSRLRLLVGLFTAQTFVTGVLNVLIVVTALEVVDLGRSGVGVLNSAVGVGGLLGAVAATAFVGRQQLASGFGFGILLWGLPIALIGVWPNAAVAVALLGCVGIGNTIVDVAGMTLLQRAADDAVLARVFGVLESLIIGSIAVGSAAGPLLIAGLGNRGALVATGLFLPLLVVLTWARLRAIDAAAIAPVERIELLQTIPIFAPLPAPALERLAAQLTPVHVSAGEEIIRRGEHGDRFYVIESGEVEIVTDEKPPVVEGRAGYFGEVALLRDVPRTATVRARTDVDLLALDRDDFLAAVTGHPQSREAAEIVVLSRLAPLVPV